MLLPLPWLRSFICHHGNSASRYHGDSVSRYHDNECAAMVAHEVMLLLLGLKDVAVGDVDVEPCEVTHRHSTIGLGEVRRVHGHLLIVAWLHEPCRVVGCLHAQNQFSVETLRS